MSPTTDGAMLLTTPTLISQTISTPNVELNALWSSSTREVRTFLRSPVEPGSDQWFPTGEIRTLDMTNLYQYSTNVGSINIVTSSLVPIGQALLVNNQLHISPQDLHDLRTQINREIDQRAISDGTHRQIAQLKAPDFVGQIPKEEITKPTVWERLKDGETF